jgi:hypothetical protein
MIKDFSLDNLDLVVKVLGAQFKKIGNLIRMEIVSPTHGSKLAAEFYFNLDVQGHPMNILSVYAPHSFLQLHNCNGFIASEVLNQVTFFGRSKDTISGLIIDREASCSLYSNVSEQLLHGDFTTLPTEIMMCSVALSLADEDTFDLEGFQFDE